MVAPAKLEREHVLAADHPLHLGGRGHGQFACRVGQVPGRAIGQPMLAKASGDVESDKAIRKQFPALGAPVASVKARGRRVGDVAELVQNVCRRERPCDLIGVDTIHQDALLVLFPPDHQRPAIDQDLVFGENDAVGHPAQIPRSGQLDVRLMNAHGRSRGRGGGSRRIALYRVGGRTPVHENRRSERKVTEPATTAVPTRPQTAGPPFHAGGSHTPCRHQP